MKKSTKSLICAVVVLVLVCLVTVTAFAVSHSGSFPVEYLGHSYIVRYEAELNVYDESADASLGISNYPGLYTGIDCELRGKVTGYNTNTKEEVTLGVFDTAGPEYASRSFTYQGNGFDPNMFINISGQCTYLFQGEELCALEKDAD